MFDSRAAKLKTSGVAPAATGTPRARAYVYVYVYIIRCYAKSPTHTWASAEITVRLSSTPCGPPTVRGSEK